jgi:hypothetical protein
MFAWIVGVEAKLTRKVWIANYVYATAAGDARTTTREIAADSYEAAQALAAEIAPAAEFVVSLHPQSDEQILGAVRHSAAKIKQDGDDIPFDYDGEEPDPDTEAKLRALLDAARRGQGGDSKD